MKRTEILQIGFLLAVAPVTVGHAQQATAMDSANPVMPPAEEVLREIDDPALGDRWLLVRNPQNPAGPGRLLRFHDEGAGGLANRNEELSAVVAEAQALALPLVSLPVVRPALPVIKNGDRIVVEEHTAVADMRLCWRHACWSQGWPKPGKRPPSKRRRVILQRRLCAIT